MTSESMTSLALESRMLTLCNLFQYDSAHCNGPFKRHLNITMASEMKYFENLNHKDCNSRSIIIILNHPFDYKSLMPIRSATMTPADESSAGQNTA